MGNRANGQAQREGPGSQPFAVVSMDLSGALSIERMDAHTFEHAANAVERFSPETRAVFVGRMILGRCSRCGNVVRDDTKWQVINNLLRCEDHRDERV